MDDWIFEEGKPTMCLDKYLKSLGINGMVQKTQIRQLMANSLTHMEIMQQDVAQIGNLLH